MLSCLSPRRPCCGPKALVTFEVRQRRERVEAVPRSGVTDAGWASSATRRPRSSLRSDPSASSWSRPDFTGSTCSAKASGVMEVGFAGGVAQGPEAQVALVCPRRRRRAPRAAGPAAGAPAVPGRSSIRKSTAQRQLVRRLPPVAPRGPSSAGAAPFPSGSSGSRRRPTRPTARSSAPGSPDECGSATKASKQVCRHSSSAGRAPTAGGMRRRDRSPPRHQVELQGTVGTVLRRRFELADRAGGDSGWGSNCMAAV